MSPLLVIALIVLLVVLFGVGTFVKGLEILLWIALALALIWVIYYFVTKLTGRGRTRL